MKVRHSSFILAIKRTISSTIKSDLCKGISMLFMPVACFMNHYENSWHLMYKDVMFFNNYCVLLFVSIYNIIPNFGFDIKREVKAKILSYCKLKLYLLCGMLEGKRVWYVFFEDSMSPF